MPDKVDITEVDLGPDAPAFIGSGAGVIVLNTNSAISARVRWELRHFAYGTKHLIEDLGEPLDMHEVG